MTTQNLPVVSSSTETVSESFCRVAAGQVHLICTVQDHDRGAKKNKNGRVLFGKLWKKEQTNSFILSIVRGSMVRWNLHHKISHNIENYLQWGKKKKKKCLFLECWFHCVNCQFDRMRFFFSTSVYAKSCPFHGLKKKKKEEVFSLLGKQVGVNAGSLSLLCSLPFRRPQRTLRFLIMSKI